MVTGNTPPRHKPDCGFDTFDRYGGRPCTCGADKPTPPAPTFGPDQTDSATIADLTAKGHTEHCAQRQVWGDGECECLQVAAGT